MARQTFEEGQTVYVKRWGNAYAEAVVVKPDSVSRYTGRDQHFVSARYYRNGKLGDKEFSILNTRRHIITADAYIEIERAKEISGLQVDIQDHRRFEEEFEFYIEQAKGIVGVVQSSAGRADVLDLLVALHLRSTFTRRSEYGRRTTTKEVAEDRAERKATAEAAHLALQGMGETPLELP